jgi:hypothetical protein
VPSSFDRACTVGGFTERTEVDDAGYESYEPLAGVGSPSPYSRTSIAWDDASTPIKPEVIFEAGITTSPRPKAGKAQQPVMS